MFDLLLITYDFPYGSGETFLETEIEYTSRYFNKIYVISTSRNKRITRDPPSNVFALKIGRYYHFFNCLLYAFFKVFSHEARVEYRDLKLLRNMPSKDKILRAWLTSWMIEKRLSIAIKELNLDSRNTIAYSYWLSASAYYLSKVDSFRFRLSRAHRFEVRDYEDYIPFRSYMDAHLDEVVFISEYTQHEYNEILKPLLRHGTRARQIVSRLGVREQDIYSNKHATDLHDLFLVSCSNITHLKRLDLIIKAIALLGNDKKVKWVHIGWGEASDEIIRLCQELLGSKSNISYNILGSRSNQEVLEFYKENPIDLFINTSDNEGIPVSIMEAMSFGIPCIARAVGGNPEIVINGVSGYLLTKDATPRVLADVIERYIDDKSFRIDPAGVLAFFKKNYSAQRNYDDFYSHVMRQALR